MIDTSPGLCNTPEHMSIHIPRDRTNVKNSRIAQQKHITFTHKHKHCRIKPDTCWGAPPRGEPVEPRPSDLRTQSPQRQEWQKTRARNTTRGLRNTQTIIIRQETRRQNTRNRKRDRRNIKSATNIQESRVMARHAATQLNRPRYQRAFRGEAEINKHPGNHDRCKTTYIRRLTEDTNIPNKPKEGITPVKIHYRREVRIATTNVRGMNESAKREQIIQHMIIQNIDIVCIQETNIPDSCIETRDSHTFIFSLNAPDKEEGWGVSFCYKSTFEKYRTNYLQVSSSVATMELSMHGKSLW